MSGVFAGNISQGSLSAWAPWFLLAMVLLYFVGYVDGSVHGGVLGAAGGNLGYVHEFFHHARHVGLMCH